MYWLSYAFSDIEKWIVKRDWRESEGCEDCFEWWSLGLEEWFSTRYVSWLSPVDAWFKKDSKRIIRIIVVERRTCCWSEWMYSLLWIVSWWVAWLFISITTRKRRKEEKSYGNVASTSEFYSILCLLEQTIYECCKATSSNCWLYGTDTVFPLISLHSLPL